MLRHSLDVGASRGHQLLLGGYRFEHGGKAEVPALLGKFKVAGGAFDIATGEFHLVLRGTQSFPAIDNLTTDCISHSAGAKRRSLQSELLESDQHADATENIVCRRHAEISSIIGVRRVAKKQDVRGPEGPTTKPNRQLLSGT